MKNRISTLTARGSRSPVLWALAAAVLATTVLANDTEDAAEAGAEAEHIIYVGASERVSLERDVKSVFVLNPAVLEATTDASGRNVIVTGKAAGRSDVQVVLMDGEDVQKTFEVRPDLTDVAEEIRLLLRDVEGLEITQTGRRLVLSGELFTSADNQRVRRVASMYGSTVMNLTRFDSAMLDRLFAEQIQEQFGLPTVTARMDNGMLIIEGEVYSQGDLERINRIVTAHQIERVINLVTVEEPMIEVEARFVQIDQANARAAGHNVLKSLRIPGRAGVSGGTGGSSVSYGIDANFNLALNALISEGYGTVIAEPRLRTRSGSEGVFMSGGETYFTIAGQVGGTLESVEHGIILRVQPTVKRDGTIENRIKITVSTPEAQSTGQLSLSKFETSNLMESQPGESVVIAGLVQSLEAEFGERTPVLGRMPIFRLFFSERGEVEQERDLVVAITCHRVSSSDADDTETVEPRDVPVPAPAREPRTVEAPPPSAPEASGARMGAHQRVLVGE